MRRLVHQQWLKIIRLGKPLMYIRVTAISAIIIGIAITSCGSPATHVSSGGKANGTETPGQLKASTHRASSRHGNTGLSTRTISPVIIESAKIEFYQDYSFIAKQASPLRPQAVASMGQQTTPLSPPPSVILANDAWIILTVAGNTQAPITINNMTAVKNCQKPFTNGALFYSPSHGAGTFTVAPVYFNLDSLSPMGMYVAIPGSNIPSGGNFFAKKVITLKYHEPQTLAVFVETKHQYCRFSFRLSIATVNGPATQDITDNGQPFEITADGEFASRPDVPFSSYPIVYAGGIADLQHHGSFIRVNPQTYHGAGNPDQFAIH